MDEPTQRTDGLFGPMDEKAGSLDGTGASVPSGEKPSDPWMDGFSEGRRSMARSIALKLRGTMPDEDLASLVGLDAAGLEELLAPPCPPPGNSPAAAQPALIRGLALVEPNFVRVVRSARGLTQAGLAKRLGVNERTVCEWETAPGPVRIKSSSYDRLVALAER